MFTCCWFYIICSKSYAFDKVYIGSNLGMRVQSETTHNVSDFKSNTGRENFHSCVKD